MTEKNLIVSNKKDIILNVTYIHVAAHLLSRGTLTMQEHRKIMRTEESNRVSTLLDIIKMRDNASRHLIDALRDPDLKGVYCKIINKLEGNNQNASMMCDSHSGLSVEEDSSEISQVYNI